MDKDMFRKKFLFPLCYIAVVGLGIMGANHMIPVNTTTQAEIASDKPAIQLIEPAAGAEANTEQAALPVEAVDAELLKDVPTVPALPNTDAPEDPPITISPDKPEIIHLSKDAVNVLVGSEETLRAVPDTNRTIILIPKKPGATFFKAIDGDGNVIAQRHVIVGSTSSKSKYMRIRRACVNGTEGCKEFSVYYCPDTCHEVNVIQDSKKSTNLIPNEVASSPSEPGQGDPNSENMSPTSTTAP